MGRLVPGLAAGETKLNKESLSGLSRRSLALPLFFTTPQSCGAGQGREG